MCHGKSYFVKSKKKEGGQSAQLSVCVMHECHAVFTFQLSLSTISGSFISRIHLRDDFFSSFFVSPIFVLRKL